MLFWSKGNGHVGKLPSIWPIWGAILVVFMAFQWMGEPKPFQFPDLKFFPKMPSSADNPTSQEGVEFGRHLFYDSLLSKNLDMSCASCHRQANAFAEPRQFSKGRVGDTRRNSMPLFNLAWYERMFWDGRAASIEEQISHPLRDSNEMDISWNEVGNRLNKSHFYKKLSKKAFGTSKIDSTLATKALGQFLRALVSARSKYDMVLFGKAYFTKDENAGFNLVNDMTRGGCMHCHTTDSDALGTTGKFSNNGLDERSEDLGLGGVLGKKEKIGWFKIPSLRNLAFTAPYMHDGRFASLEQVLDFYSKGVKTHSNIDSKMEHAREGGARLSAEEKRQVIAFLNTLNDHEFVADKRFSNPFITPKR